MHLQSGSRTCACLLGMRCTLSAPCRVVSAPPVGSLRCCFGVTDLAQLDTAIVDRRRGCPALCHRLLLRNLLLVPLGLVYAGRYGLPSRTASILASPDSQTYTRQLAQSCVRARALRPPCKVLVVSS